jgi:hypothetical protein
LLAVLLAHETVEAIGAWLIGWIVAAGCGELSCWKYSTTITGLAAIISAYVALRMTVEGLYQMGLTAKELAREPHEAFDIWNVVWSNYLVCITVSLAALPYYTYLSPWVASHFEKVHNQDYLRIVQGVIIGVAIGVGLAICNFVRYGRTIRATNNLGDRRPLTE